MDSIIDISWWQLGLFMMVLALPAVINWQFELKLGRDFLVAIVRMTVQLVMVGLYLQFLFSLDSPALNFLWLLMMLTIGASSILSSTKLPKKILYLPVLAGLVVGLLPLLATLLLVLLQPSPVYSAQYLIPLAGMLLGNSLSGNIVALQHLFNAFKDKLSEYEGALALGASPKQASFMFVQAALRQSLAPLLTAMTTTGLVTLPGMMTGQILSGSDPMVAIKYQLVIMIAIFVMLTVSVAVSLTLAIRYGLHSSGKVLIAQEI